MQSKEQKEDMLSVYVDEEGRPFKFAGKIDYVSAWYYKAAKFMQGTDIQTAFVSTNSITQGDQVAFVWKPLYEMFGVSINFAYRTFKWNNEAKGQAAVHCVIVGFDVSRKQNALKIIFDEEGNKRYAKNISPYLIDMETIFVESRKKPLSNIPTLLSGNRATDGGHLILSEDDYSKFVENEPQALPYIKRYMMGYEFINNKVRYCLWLVNCPPSELKRMPLVLERV
ncbi:MAG: hypothetical protein Q4Q04_02700, partial [Methanocorpusculum sp.]|nr:hypothetical protein [Methanocorpusculum sp.]